MNRNVTDFSPQALEMFTAYDWPGNIREVRNVVERAMVVAKGTQIQVDDLSFPFLTPSISPDGESLEEVEKRQIEKVLNQTKGNIAQAADILKISRLTIYNKIEKYHLKR
jgi:two-component system response regulator HydG